MAEESPYCVGESCGFDGAVVDSVSQRCDTASLGGRVSTL